jgi:hypothetical protein
MVITLMIRQDAARALQGLDPATSDSQAIAAATAELGVVLSPVHPGNPSPELVGTFNISVPDRAAADRAIARLRQIPAVEGAYVKPSDALP